MGSRRLHVSESDLEMEPEMPVISGPDEDEDDDYEDESVPLNPTTDDLSDSSTEDMPLDTEQFFILCCQTLPDEYTLRQYDLESLNQ